MRFFFRQPYLFRAWVVCVFLLTGPVCFSDVGSIRIASYNLRNYLVSNRMVGNQWRFAYPKPEDEKQMVRQIIREVDPDVLILQEMGAVPFLKELQGDLSLEGLDYEYAIHLEAADPDRYLAVLSKIQPKEVVKHTDLEFKYFEGRESVKRGMLEINLEWSEGHEFSLFAVHLKSRYQDNKADPLSARRRTREAEACRNRIIERTHERGRSHYLIVGDFNDHPKSAPLRRFYVRGGLKIGSLLPVVDHRGEVWTYYYRKAGRYEQVDGFVASSELLPYIQSGTARIADLPGAMKGSDHRMVYLDLYP